MAEFTEQQIKELDIDWYCLIHGKPTHIASMGGMIPKRFRDRKKLRLQQDMVAMMIPFVEVKLNMENIQNQIADGYEYLQDKMIKEAIEDANRNNLGFAYLNDYELPVRLFASTFVEKAKRGFRSFARREGAERNEYILIAEPINPVEFNFNQLNLQELECEQLGDGNSFVIR